jgi:hypothetical protein
MALPEPHLKALALAIKLIISEIDSRDIGCPN